jgi:hypothetical protein
MEMEERRGRGMLIRQMNKQGGKIKRERGGKELRMRKKGDKKRNHIPHHHTTIEELLKAVVSTRSVMYVKDKPQHKPALAENLCISCINVT